MLGCFQFPQRIFYSHGRDSDLLMFLLYSEGQGKAKRLAPAHPGVRGVEPPRGQQLAGGRHPLLRPRRGAQATRNRNITR
jgi:hypothetical protein